ncbi:MAG: DUF2202 domain-containing protein [Epsilonproteobacteria bacterium]|nr:DUF2202 domain-containing protein [Campylobacterota bacterium]
MKMIKKLSLAVITAGLVFTGCGSSSSSSSDTTSSVNTFESVTDTINTTPKVDLDQETKNTLSYMGNEERLAHDVYLNLYNYHLANGTTIQQLGNIAINSETQHIQTVQLLVRKYITSPDEFTNVDMTELNYKDTDLNDMEMGKYDISHIQSLYDTLYAKGIQSAKDALEVGCMVEVTDINDLLHDIAVAQNSGATDIVTAFEFLRDGSYNHYWSFDRGLKNMGIEDGCCSLGDAYCHPEYPQNENQGGGNGQGKGRQ